MSALSGAVASLLERWGVYLDQGGFVMPFLALSAALLWFALGYRWLTLQRGSRHGVRRIVQRYRDQLHAAASEQRADAAATTAPAPAGPTDERGILCAAARRAVQVADRARAPRLRSELDCALGDDIDQLGRFEILARAIVIVAPLAGLLGTVAGMIETFEALGDMSLFSQSGGVAGGISQALISTQMGLAVAIPGLLIGRLLARRQRRLRDEIEQIKDVLCGDLCADPACVPVAQAAGGRGCAG